MNKFKYSEADNKLWLDIPVPKRSDFGVDVDSKRMDIIYAKAMANYDSRLSYSLSPELRDKLKDGEVIGENEFSKLYQQLFTGNYFSKAAWLNSTEEQYQYLSEDYRRIIAIPLPEQKSNVSMNYNWNPKVTMIQDGKEIDTPEQTNKVKEPERFTLDEIDPAKIANDIWDKTDPMITSCMQKSNFIIGACEMFKYIKNNQP